MKNLPIGHTPSKGGDRVDGKRNFQTGDFGSRTGYGVI